MVQMEPLILHSGPKKNSETTLSVYRARVSVIEALSLFRPSSCSKLSRVAHASCVLAISFHLVVIPSTNSGARSAQLRTSRLVLVLLLLTALVQQPPPSPSSRSSATILRGPRQF